MPATRGHLWLRGRRGDLRIRYAVSNDHAVCVVVFWGRRLLAGTTHHPHWILLGEVLKRPGHHGWLGDDAGEWMAAFDGGFAPNKLLHCLRRLNPRTTGLTPS